MLDRSLPEKYSDTIFKVGHMKKQEIVSFYDKALDELRAADPTFPIATLNELESDGQITMPAKFDRQMTIANHVFISPLHQDALVLRSGKLWINVPSAALRKYLLGAFSNPEWHEKTWDDVKYSLLAPGNEEALARFFESVKEHPDLLSV